MPHGNSNKNNLDHHLYELRDRVDGAVFKYGISDKSIDADGLSDRMREQLDFLNLAVGWLRYFGRILMTGIKPRVKARRLEQDHIDAFEKEHGHLPRGNPLRRGSKMDDIFPG